MINNDGALKFLVNEFAPELNAEQAQEFLTELSDLGVKYLAQNTEIKVKLDQAILHCMPDEFFSLLDDSKAKSLAFDNVVALGNRGLVYLGDEDISSNYMEIIVKAMRPSRSLKNVSGISLYEPLKDYALARQMRSDVWCRPPSEAGASMAELFGSFVYGISMAKNDVPSILDVAGDETFVCNAAVSKPY